MAPERTCFGCGRKGTKDGFIRLAVLPGGRVEIDRRQTAGGRGLYLCPETACFGRARRRKPPPAVTRRGAARALAELLDKGPTEIKSQRGFL